MHEILGRLRGNSLPFPTIGKEALGTTYGIALSSNNNGFGSHSLCFMRSFRIWFHAFGFWL
jgi:hypothetical protein